MHGTDILIITVSLLIIFFIVKSFFKPKHTQRFESTTAHEDVYNQTSNYPVSNQPLVEKVLNDYYMQGIQIQTEIVEDLSARTSRDEIEIIQFIESRRKAWKAENTKPFYKGGVR